MTISVWSAAIPYAVKGQGAAGQAAPLTTANDGEKVSANDVVLPHPCFSPEGMLTTHQPAPIETTSS